MKLTPTSIHMAAMAALAGQGISIHRHSNNTHAFRLERTTATRPSRKRRRSAAAASRKKNRSKKHG